MEPLKHTLIPEQEKITADEKKELLERFSITLKDLPRIYGDDLSISSLGAKPGDVIRIKRKSATAGNTEYYRVVV